MADVTGDGQEHWIRAARSWALRDSPLRPSREDIHLYQRCLQRWREASRHGPLSALLLGVTPEIAAMSWPAGAVLLAADLSRAMIGGLWPGAGAAPGHAAVCARWQALPLADGSQDLIIGDGCFSALVGDDYPAMAQSLRRVVRPRGQVLMRFFVRPDERETPARVFSDLHAGWIGSFHAFKWRLAMALHPSLDAGVRLGAIWDAWNAAVSSPAELARSRGWPLPVVLTIDDFRGGAGRYTFPTLSEVRAVMAEGFEEVSCDFPGYELGERCPVMAFRPR